MHHRISQVCLALWLHTGCCVVCEIYTVFDTSSSIVHLHDQLSLLAYFMGSEADSIERDVRSPPVDVQTTVMPHVNALTGFCTAQLFYSIVSLGSVSHRANVRSRVPASITSIPRSGALRRGMPEGAPGSKTHRADQHSYIPHRDDAVLPTNSCG